MRREFTPPEIKEHLGSVLERIDSVIREHKPHVREFEDPWLYNALELCGGYSEVILYGFTRRICLRVVSNRLYSRDYVVSWDIKGTV